MSTTTSNGVAVEAEAPASICVIPPSRTAPQGGVRLTVLPARVDLQLYAGDDVLLEVTVNDQGGQPYDLAGVTVDAQIRAEVIGPGNTPANGVLGAFTSTVSANLILLQLAGSVSARIPPTAVWDVQLTRPDTTIITVAAGTVTMAGQVTI